jgi:hypothetical protein
MKRWQKKISEDRTRWTMEEIDELKEELNKRSRLDALYIICASALGSLQFDLVDAKNTSKS